MRIRRKHCWQTSSNSANGKFIDTLEWQTDVIYTKDEKVVDRRCGVHTLKISMTSGRRTRCQSCKQQIIIKHPCQVGIAVYQSAKLRMLEFYYDFLDYYAERKDFELIQMDTDRRYLALG